MKLLMVKNVRFSSDGKHGSLKAGRPGSWKAKIR